MEPVTSRKMEAGNTVVFGKLRHFYKLSISRFFLHKNQTVEKVLSVADYQLM
jgi:hypothetical protein